MFKKVKRDKVNCMSVARWEEKSSGRDEQRKGDERGKNILGEMRLREPFLQEIKGIKCDEVKCMCVTGRGNGKGGGG